METLNYFSFDISINGRIIVRFDGQFKNDRPIVIVHFFILTFFFS